MPGSVPDVCARHGSVLSGSQPCRLRCQGVTSAEKWGETDLTSPSDFGDNEVPRERAPRLPSLETEAARGAPVSPMVDAETLYQDYGALVLSIASRLCPRREDAEDVFQDTFVEVVRGAHRFRGPGPVEAWLCSIVKAKA
jgi:hypothetical protein